MLRCHKLAQMKDKKMTAPKIAFLCGSTRKGSINQQLQHALIKRFKTAGAACEIINLETYNLPLYHGDLELPQAVKSLAAKLAAHDGVVVISPEYNGGLTPMLKNAIDWTSTHDTTHFKTCYWGIASCTPGPMSGVMGLRQLNYILMRVGCHVSPIQVGVGNADTAFDADNNLIAEPSASLADKMMADMLEQITRKTAAA